MKDEAANTHREFTAASRFWMLLLTFSAIFWLGGITLRAVIANEFFITGTLEYHPEITMDQERTLFQLIYASSIFVLVNYIIAAVSAALTLRNIPLRFKDNGWLLMSSLLFFIFVPVEMFTAYLDVKFILLWTETRWIIEARGALAYAEHSAVMRETLSHRIGALGGLPVMALISYFTAVAVIILQPLKMRRTAGHDRTAEQDGTVSAVVRPM